MANAISRAALPMADNLAARSSEEAEVALVAGDGPADRLSPEKDVRSVLAPLDRERPGEIDEDFGRSRKRGKAAGESFAVKPDAARFGEEMRDGLVELTPGDGFGAAAVPQRFDLFPHEAERIDDPGEALRIFKRRLAPILAGVGERDEMSGEIAAVDRRDILRVEGAEAFRIVPIVEMAAISLELRHRRHRRLEPLDRVERARPAEIVRARRREEIEAEIGRRGAAGENRRRLFLEIVRRKHVVAGVTKVSK